MLLAAYSGHTPAEIIAFPIDKLFAELKLPALVPMRSNGLTAMVRRIQAIAKLAADRETTPQVATGTLPLVPLKPKARRQRPARRNRRSRSCRRRSPPASRWRRRRWMSSRFAAIFRSWRTKLGDRYPLVYLDNAATTQRPRQVIEAMVEAYEHYYSNVHRAGHRLAMESSAHYEAARESVRQLINARSPTEIIFTPGTTAAINLVARSWGDANLKAGDEILLTLMEHHSNIVPWQQLAAAHRLHDSLDADHRRLASSTWTPSSGCSRRERSSSPSRPSRTCSARSTRSTRSSSWPTPPARSSWSTPPRPCRTSRSMCGRGTSISWPSAGTRCSARRASACSTAARTCSTGCRRSSAAAA